MQTRLAEHLRGTAAGTEAERILRSCVHCGFCTATCPTYALLGDELDGPRGRIYLIKRVVEGAPATHRTQLHLDRCLTCRACETTCPSGVEYGRLLDIGRALVDMQVPRARGARLARALLRAGLTSRAFAPIYRLGQWLRPLLPAVWREKVVPRRAPGAWPSAPRTRRVLLPAGCVQGGMMPAIDAATARVLDRVGIAVLREERGAGCCGALRQHLGDADGALAAARRNVDAWWPAVESGVEAIVSNASGCGVQIKDYAHLLAGDTRYAERARRVASLARDLAEVLAPEAHALAAQLAPAECAARIAFHPPCTLQHGQKLAGVVERLLGALGVELLAFAESRLCCGSAGTYSMLQPALAGQLRERKLAQLSAARPELILSANVGCIAHLGAASAAPVRHWVEWLDQRLAASSRR
jgi:glycolate oxidase iron-sulfur subunit